MILLSARFGGQRDCVFHVTMPVANVTHVSQCEYTGVECVSSVLNKRVSRRLCALQRHSRGCVEGVGSVSRCITVDKYVDKYEV
jgi:hypothetical protein